MAVNYRSLILKPHWMQYFIDQFPFMFLGITCIMCYGIKGFFLREISLYAALVILAYLLYRSLYFASMEYILTGEQLIFQHGVVSHTTEYMELYRVVDYKQKRSLPQQLFGLKTVTVMSGDRTMPILNITGVKNLDDIVPEIRQRVEYNKRKRGVYEITNRF